MSHKGKNTHYYWINQKRYSLLSYNNGVAVLGSKSFKSLPHGIEVVVGIAFSTLDQYDVPTKNISNTKKIMSLQLKQEFREI